MTSTLVLRGQNAASAAAEGFEGAAREENELFTRGTPCGSLRTGD